MVPIPKLNDLHECHCALNEKWYKKNFEGRKISIKNAPVPFYILATDA